MKSKMHNSNVFNLFPTHHLDLHTSPSNHSTSSHIPPSEYNRHQVCISGNLKSLKLKWTWSTTFIWFWFDRLIWFGRDLSYDGNFFFFFRFWLLRRHGKNQFPFIDDLLSLILWLEVDLFPYQPGFHLWELLWHCCFIRENYFKNFNH